MTDGRDERVARSVRFGGPGTRRPGTAWTRTVAWLLAAVNLMLLASLPLGGMLGVLAVIGLLGMIGAFGTWSAVFASRRDGLGAAALIAVPTTIQALAIGVPVLVWAPIWAVLPGAVWVVALSTVVVEWRRERSRGSPGEPARRRTPISRAVDSGR
jgi:hypothetical protein